MADRRIYAGYYRRYDGKMIYVVTMAKDADTDEEVVIWTPTVFSEKRTYYTMSKRSFCEYVSVDGVCKAKFNRQTQMRMPLSVVEGFEEDGFVRPQRRTSNHIEEYDDWHRPNATTYYEYAKMLCEGYRFSEAKYAQAHDLNRGSVDYLQQKFFVALAQALKERDDADGRSRLQTKQDTTST